MTRRLRRLQAKVATHTKLASRKHKNTPDPNDRPYDVTFQKSLRRMKPEQLDELLHGDTDESSSRP
jgi:hypothetical protein